MAIYKLVSNSISQSIILDGLLTSNTTFNAISGNTISFNRVTGNAVTIAANTLSLTGNVSLTTNNLISNVVTSTTVSVGGNVNTTNLVVTAGMTTSNISVGSILIVPVGSTAERPLNAANGMLRFNSSTGTYEAYKGSWGAIGGAGATGGGSDEIFYLNGINVTASYSIPSGKNAMTAGPVTVNDGVTVTVPDGSAWTIV